MPNFVNDSSHVHQLTILGNKKEDDGFLPQIIGQRIYSGTYIRARSRDSTLREGVALIRTTNRKPKILHRIVNSTFSYYQNYTTTL